MAHARKKQRKRALRAVREAEQQARLTVKRDYTPYYRQIPTQQKLLSDVENILSTPQR